MRQESRNQFQLPQVVALFDSRCLTLLPKLALDKPAASPTWSFFTAESLEDEIDSLNLRCLAADICQWL